MGKDAAPFPYMRWAKANLAWSEPLTLGMSGLPRPEAADRAGLAGPLLDGDRDPELGLREALARRYGLPLEGVRLACGTSHANFLVFLALARGGAVASETPAYEAFPRLAEAVGARVTFFERDPRRGWRIDAASLARAAGPGTRLLAVTDLHNPSGARLRPDDLDRLVDAAHALDAWVLVDEVYLDLDPLDRPTAARRDPRVLATNSLTKSHGLGDLRAGWVLGAPEVVAELDAWDDLVCPRLPLLPMREALAWLPEVPAHLARVRARCRHLTDIVDAWVRARPDVDWQRPDGGFTGFLRLGTPAAPIDGEALAARALEVAAVRVVPGRFFQSREWIRISYWLDDDRLHQALAGLGRALDAFG